MRKGVDDVALGQTTYGRLKDDLATCEQRAVDLRRMIAENVEARGLLEEELRGLPAKTERARRLFVEQQRIVAAEEGLPKVNEFLAIAAALDLGETLEGVQKFAERNHRLAVMNRGPLLGAQRHQRHDLRRCAGSDCLDVGGPAFQRRADLSLIAIAVVNRLDASSGMADC
jgi:hypothetical protein